ncbi:protein osteopotentia homolog [Clonorchis sinensis]|uniref:Protein osteopotentia homolog n=1 Tax=Clonorchis sinensis TaxID=79923 RepID=H2KRG1_CLOSI|nr:protein osteopotentia homolog [Clonorchis sinensis]
MLSEGSGAAASNGGGTEQKTNKGTEKPSRTSHSTTSQSRQARGDKPHPGVHSSSESTDERRSKSQATRGNNLARGESQMSVEDEHVGSLAPDDLAEKSSIGQDSSFNVHDGDGVHMPSGQSRVSSSTDPEIHRAESARSNSVDGVKSSVSNDVPSEPKSTGLRSAVPVTLRRNVAAVACGAKLLDSSKAIKNAESILNGNNDEYMNVPCSAEKWFVIEVCEPVQLRVVEMANYELFSSRVKSFRVLVSDRYPAKTWDTIGVFTAQDVKGLQTFDVSSDKLIKYVKFEMLEHYGSEHYCPISMIRLFGLVSDDLDDDDDELPMHQVNQQLPTGGVPSSTLFDSVPAVDPKNVPYGDADLSRSHQGTDAVELPTVLNPPESMKIPQADPLRQAGSTDLPPSSQRVIDDTHPGEDTGHGPQQGLPNRAAQLRTKPQVDSLKDLKLSGELHGGHADSGKDRAVRKLDHSEKCRVDTNGVDGAPMDRVAVTDATTTMSTPVQSIGTTPMHPVHGDRSAGSGVPSRQSSADFVRKTDDHSSAVTETDGNFFAKIKNFFRNVFSTSFFRVTVPETTHVDYNLSAIQLCPHHLAAIDSLLSYGLLNASLDSSTTLFLSGRSRRGITALSTCLFQLEQLVQPVTVVLGHSPVTVTHRILSIPRKVGATAFQSCSEASQLLNITFFNGYHPTDQLQATVRPNVEYNILQLLVAYQYRYQFKQHSTVVSSALVSHSPLAPCGSWWTPNQLSLPENSVCPKLPDFLLTVDRYSEQDLVQRPPQVNLSLSAEISSHSTHPRQPELSMSETIVVPAGLSGSRKDTVMMRLSNRVRLLERNVSVSMRYLEELSQSYRHQMERLSRSFNLTNAWLKATAQGAQERDQLQQARIDQLELRLEELLTRIRNGSLASAPNASVGLLDDAASLRNLQNKQNNTLAIEMFTPPLPNFDPPPDWNPSPSVYYGQWTQLDEDWGDEDAFVETEEETPTHASHADEPSTKSGLPHKSSSISCVFPLRDHAGRQCIDVHTEEPDSWWQYFRTSWNRCTRLFLSSSRWLSHVVSTHTTLFGMISMACVHFMFALTSHVLIYLVWLRPHGRKLSMPPSGSFTLIQSRSGEWLLTQNPTHKTGLISSGRSQKPTVPGGTVAISCRGSKDVVDSIRQSPAERKIGVALVKPSSSIPRCIPSAQNRKEATSPGNIEYHQVTPTDAIAKISQVSSPAFPTTSSTRQTNGGLKVNGSMYYEKFVPSTHSATHTLPRSVGSHFSKVQSSNTDFPVYMPRAPDPSAKFVQAQHKSIGASPSISCPSLITQHSTTTTTEGQGSSNSSTLTSRNARRRRKRLERAKMNQLC